MYLSKLLENIVSLPLQAERAVSSLALDSREVKKGSLFFAIQGTKVDGRKYIDQAISSGALAVLMNDDARDSIHWRGEIPLIAIAQLNEKIGEIAAKFYDYPARKLPVIGITGTSGKTSCTQFIAQILQMHEHLPCGVIGTLGKGFYGALDSPSLTTPDAITLQSSLHQFVNAGAKAIAMEVSSHSIDQGRINGIEFDIGIFTNLTQDHLDYHHDMATYAAVKHRFITKMPIKHLLINADDQYGKEWLSELKGNNSLFAFSTRTPKADIVSPIIYAQDVELSLKGTHAHIMSPWGEGSLSLPLLGEFNLSNALASLGALCLMNIPFPGILHALSQLKTVPGRMQTLGGAHKPLVVVDYAHKPDALEKVLQTLRRHTLGKLYCVFGCGGERDRDKRPKMAKIAERWADKVIVTNDNPRHEKPEAIAAEIMQGFTDRSRVSVVLDRSKAIEKSILWAQADDCVLIAGKGSECYQQFGDEKIPFDDVSEALKYL